jgi:glycosyltransferase involved in cell wall biosynthesis
MIMCFAAWDRPGGLSTMFRAYYRDLQIDVPHFWVLIGKGDPPVDLRPGTHCLRIEDDWKIYEDSALVEPGPKSAIEKLIREKRARALMLPLEYHFFPYLQNVRLPVLYISHLMNRPLIESSRAQWYGELNGVNCGMYADLVRSRCEDEALRRSHFVICNSQGTLEDLMKYYELPGLGEAFASPLGVETRKWSGIPLGDANTVLYFGRIAQQKGVPNLRVSPSSQLRLIIVGSGRLRSWLESQLPNAQFEPHAEELEKFLGMAKFCVFPSHYEPWGLALNEALAAGKICIAQKGVCGHEEQIQDGINGYLVDFNRHTLDEIVENLRANPLERVSFEAKRSARHIGRHLEEVRKIVNRFYESSISSE